MGKLVIVRHGESRWNLCNRFTGWVDVPLSEEGVREAQSCAQHCAVFDFDAAFTSDLERTQETLLIILSAQGRTAVVQHVDDIRYRTWLRQSNRCSTGDIPVFRNEHLNERYYGSLQGMDKAYAEKRYGKEKVFLWRRGYDDRPPGGAETLREAFERAWPYVRRKIVPRVRRGETILLAGHGNTLRTIIKHFEGISEEDALFIDLPEAQAIVYDYRHGAFVRAKGEYRFNRPLR